VAIPRSIAPSFGRSMLVVNSRISIPDSELEFTFARSSGPGGQNVNKVSSKAVLRWRVTESPSLPPEVRERFLTRYRARVTTDGDVIVSSQLFRDQGRNVANALDKLREMIAAVAVAPKKRRPTRPSAASRRRRIETKQKRSTTKKLRRRVSDE
ncbi:MAG TPA: alternative ribosome rescue aminoacyl-tRNA hydrolase ArfB, partial [Pirellulales bacterium]|nr:alternative ribosome rescue aminoacyl-tRNA hydrolase ArfB [Pirellulales bacterium]